ncbi:MAG TPA: hypothetical protein VH142_25080 [Polyangiaceae bacterium]|nr:hypothetical protein [Polyangiaceae bacterium]
MPFVRALSVLAALGVSGCFPPDDGRTPPLDSLYFPVGIVLRSDPAHEESRLYVVNSDFDLQYNAGTVQAYDMDRLEALVPTYCDADADCASDGASPVCDAVSTTTHAASHWCVPSAGAEPCGALGEEDPADRRLTPGRCNYVQLGAPQTGGGSLMVDAVEIGAFATDMIFRPRPATPNCAPVAPDGGATADGGASTSNSPAIASGRLFVPVRGDATLHWIDVGDVASGGKFDCGQGSGRACDDNHRRGETPIEESPNGTDLILPPEPFGVAADAPGEAVLTTHQGSGQVALFVNDWSDGDQGGPSLQFTLPVVSTGALAITDVPPPAIVGEDATISYQPSFLMTYADVSTVTLLRYFSDRPLSSGCDVDGLSSEGSQPRPFLEGGRSVAIRTNSQGFNSRGIVADPSVRQQCEASCLPEARAQTQCLAACVAAQGTSATQQACEATCPGARHACLLNCAATPLDVYVSNRAPATLIFGQTPADSSATLTDDLPSFYGTFPVEVGASRVIVAKIPDRDGSLVTRVFLVCFDSQEIFVYDPVSRQLDTVIHTGRGPHAFAVDSARGLGFIGLFTDSYLAVVDLNRAHTANYGEIVLNLGQPQEPRASK